MKTTTFPHKLQIRINKRIFAPPPYGRLHGRLRARLYLLKKAQRRALQRIFLDIQKKTSSSPKWSNNILSIFMKCKKK